jgi:hypothetical protein
MAGGYRRLDWRHAPVVVIAAVPEALAAAKYLSEEGVAAKLTNLTSPWCLFESWRQATHTGGRADAGLQWIT